MMQRRGHRAIIVYLDDWLIIADSKEECELVLSTLLSLLRSLGFAISYGKVEAPTTCLTFLGIQVDSVSMTLSLPGGKVADLGTLLDSFADKQHATRKQLQSLAGKLNWAAQVIRGGRTFLRRLFNAIDCIASPRHKIRLDEDFHSDLAWWREYLSVFNGRQIETPLSRPEVAIEIDSCTDASGIAHETDWLFSPWAEDWPEAHGLHINHKEALSMVLAARR